MPGRSVLKEKKKKKKKKKKRIKRKNKQTGNQKFFIFCRSSQIFQLQKP